MAELNLDTMRTEILPNLLAAYLGPRGYRAESSSREILPGLSIDPTTAGESARMRMARSGFSAFASLRFHLARPDDASRLAGRLSVRRLRAERSLATRCPK